MNSKLVRYSVRDDGRIKIEDTIENMAKNETEDMPNGKFDSGQAAITSVRPERQVTILKKMRNQMQQQVDIMELLVGEAGGDGGDILGQERLVFVTLVTSRVENTLKNAWPDIRRSLDNFKIEAELNLVEKEMRITSMPDTFENYMLKAKDLLMLLARGFPPEQALLVMKDGYVCDFIKIGGNIATREEFIKRRKRLIGPQGLTLKTIEHLTQCYLYVYGNTVCIVGKGYDGINVAGEIINDCMNKINPISHIRRLVIMQELEKDSKIKRNDWIRFLPPVKKNDINISQMNLRKVDFLKDPPNQMTYGRRIALYLMQYNWYYPKKPEEISLVIDEESSSTTEVAPLNKNQVKIEQEFSYIKNEIEPPAQLEKGWAYFEHSTLPRYLVDPHAKRPSNIFMKLLTMNSVSMEIAEPGEFHKPTKLYSAITTPLKQMGDFGIGVGLYFSTLRAITMMSFVAGLISLVNMRYYLSPDYSPGKESFRAGLDVFDLLLEASAICRDTEMVPCIDCFKDSADPESEFGKDRFSMAPDQSFDFLMKNICNLDNLLRLGLLNFATILFVFLTISQINTFSEKMEVQFDEDEQTAQDYSLMVANPPIDAKDPEEWKTYFESITGGHVTVCTVAVNNDILLQTLVQRRNILETLRLILPPMTPMNENNLAKIAANCEAGRSTLKNFFASVLYPLGLGSDEASLYDEFVVLNSKVRGLSQITYPATKVYVTFETEQAQRVALNALSIGKLDVYRQNITKLKKKYLFRGRHVLLVNEPQEPSAVRWEDLNASFISQARQITLTTILSLGAIFACGLLVQWLYEENGTSWSALGISFANTAFPTFAKMMSTMEPHPSESSKQSSLYFKIALFRWANTAIIITVITPFPYTIMPGTEHLINAVQKIFISEILTINLIQLSDAVGNAKRHILAPRATTQIKMNKLFQGTSYELAERYTNMTKIMFLSFCYCAIYPGSFFISSIALSINYFTDAWSLMRTWSPAPKLGSAVSEMSRKYFFSTALFFLSYYCSLHWSGFPFDNLCPIVDGMNVQDKLNFQNRVNAYGKTFNFTVGKNYEEITINENTTFYQFCNQNFLTSDVSRIPLPRFQGPVEWMTRDQRILSTLFTYTTLTIIIYICLRFLYELYKSILSWFKSDYEPSGEDMKINFSNVEVISAYIPQVKNDTYLNPLIACDIDDLNEDLFDWTDPDKDYMFYSLVNDAKVILARTDGNVSTDDVFSKVKNWEPGRKKRSMYDSDEE